jgi:hypothetical protein
MNAVTKAYIDAMVTGVMWHSHKPVAPIVGDCFFCQTDNRSYIWQGLAWIPFSGEDNEEGEEEFTPPTEEQLEKHPALKQAWEEFIVIKRLLGV